MTLISAAFARIVGAPAGTTRAFEHCCGATGTVSSRMVSPLPRLIAPALAGCLATAALTACATPPTDPALRAEFDRINDPLEPMNRTIFAGNMAIDKAVIRPVSIAYRDVVPEPARDGVHNALQNLEEPVIFVNKLLQGEPGSALMTLGRFVANSTFGLAGLIDVATPEGLLRQEGGDFGATLHVWGVEEGPYLMLPFFGPSNPRDTVGLVVDSFTSPWGYLFPTEASIALFAAEGIDQRARVVDQTDEIERSSVDYYATIRSISRQARRGELSPGEEPNGDDFYIDPAGGAGDIPSAPAEGTSDVDVFIPTEPAAPGAP
jgi:phospholipid-binding lipoprotein MlaA